MDAENQRDYTPKPLTAAQNIVLTLKILGGSVVLLGLLWLADLAAS